MLIFKKNNHYLLFFNLSLNFNSIFPFTILLPCCPSNFTARVHVSTLRFQSPARMPPAGTPLGTRLICVPFHVPHPGSCPDHMTETVLRKSRIIYRLSKTPSLLSLFSRTLHTVLLLTTPSFPKL